jgi:biopolymer transport protein ExbD
MRIPNHHDIERHNDAAMTPMIDVVFLLLIFLLCASTNQIQESLLPTDLAAGAIESDQVEVQPKPFGEVWLYLRTGRNGRSEVQVNQGGETYADFDRLERQLKLLATATTEIDPKVPLGDMIRVYDISRAAGFESINFAIDRPETKPRPK